MNLLDLIIVVVAVSAVLAGWRLGLLARAASWIGLAAGLLVAARLLPTIISALQDAQPTGRLLVAASVLVGGAFVGQGIGLLIGAQFQRVLPVGPLRLADRILGAVAGLVGVLVMVWAMIPAMSNVSGWPARESRQSAIARAIDRLAPKPPDTLQALRRLVGADQFPQVFSDLVPSHAAGSPPTSTGLSAAVQERVAASTVKVSGVACHRIQEGSGWAVGADLIVTNAHVVAGQRRTEVLKPNGVRLSATVIVFDAERDLAVLRVADLGDPGLPLGKGHTGQTVGVFGHPGGQDALRIAPASLSDEVTAVGRDLYDAHTTRRDVFIMASDIHPGDSGAAVVASDGSVIGVAFAIAPDRPGTAYALTASEVRPVVQQATGSAAVDTGPCLTSA